MSDEAELQPAVKKGRKHWKWIMALIAVLLVASLAGNVVLWFKYSDQKTLAESLSEVYSENYFHFDSITVDSFKEKVASGEEFVVLITRPNCPNCARLERPFIQLVERKGIADKIYHLNIVLLRRDADAWALFKETYEFEGTPTYARFADGKLVSNVGWTYDVNIEYDMVERWVEEQSDYFGR